MSYIFWKKKESKGELFLSKQTYLLHTTTHYSLTVRVPKTQRT